MITVGNLDTPIEIQKPTQSTNANYGGVHNTTWISADGDTAKTIWAYHIFRGGGENEEGDQLVGSQKVDFFIRYETYKDLISPTWRIKYYLANHPSLGSDIIQNGDFTNYSAEILINPGFTSTTPIGTTGSGWAKITGGSSIVTYLANGISLTRDGGDCVLQARDSVNSSNVLTVDQTYKLTYQVVQNTNNEAKLQYYNGSTYTQLTNTVGTHTVFFQQASSQTFQLEATVDNKTIILDNVSIKETGEYWLEGAGWSYTVNGVTHSSASATSIETDSYSIPTSVKYRTTITVSDMTTGTLNIYFGASQLLGTINANGTHTFDAIATEQTLRIESNGFNGTLNSAAVQTFTDSVRYYYIDKIDHIDGRHKMTKLHAVEKDNN